MDETDLLSAHPTIPQQIEEEKTDEEEDEIQEEEAGPDEEEDEIQEEEAGPSTSRKRGRPRKGEQEIIEMCLEDEPNLDDQEQRMLNGKVTLTFKSTFIAFLS